MRLHDVNRAAFISEATLQLPCKHCQIGLACMQTYMFEGLAGT